MQLVMAFTGQGDGENVMWFGAGTAEPVINNVVRVVCRAFAATAAWL